MAFVALKPCCFAGQSFKIGETVPDELIHPGTVKNLIAMKVLAKQAEETTTAHTTLTEKPITTLPATIPIVIRDVSTADGEMIDAPLEVSPEGIQQIFDVLMATTTEAEPIIKAMTENNALILLNLTDKRKSIQAATEERGLELEEMSEE